MCPEPATLFEGHHSKEQMLLAPLILTVPPWFGSSGSTHLLGE